MPFELTILGSNSAIPVHGRHHTSQHLKVENKNYLIDCGEATQHQLGRYKLKSLRIDVIFISHLHGDHYLGLIGLLSSMHLMGRKRKLELYSPRGLAEIITIQLKYSVTVLRYPLNFHIIDTEVFQPIYEDKWVTVSSIPLKHRIPCTGFLFKAQQQGLRLNKSILPSNLTINQLKSLKKGEDLHDEEGLLIHRNKDLTLPPKRAVSYAFCSDTRYLPDIAHFLKHVDVIYHEATFLTEKELWASKTFHSTTGQAAQLAKRCKAGMLLLGHFSARYKDLTPILEEARNIFKNSELAIEGKVFSIDP